MKGRVLAVDYGAKRTGLAVSDPLRLVAHPLPPVVTEDLDETVQAIVEQAREREVTTLLVGMPYLRSGLEGAQVARVRLFISALREKLPPGVAVVDRDERFTTAEAERLWRDAGYSRKDAKPFLDSTAAVVLLREFLEEPGSGDGPAAQGPAG